MQTPEALREEAHRLLAEARKIESLPVDDFEDGNVITFTKTFGGREYDYAAIKTQGGWYRTGRVFAGRQPHNLSWRELLDFIGDDLDTVEYPVAAEFLVGS